MNCPESRFSNMVRRAVVERQSNSIVRMDRERADRFRHETIRSRWNARGRAWDTGARCGRGRRRPSPSRAPPGDPMSLSRWVHRLWNFSAPQPTGSEGERGDEHQACRRGGVRRVRGDDQLRIRSRRRSGDRGSRAYSGGGPKQLMGLRVAGSRGSILDHDRRQEQLDVRHRENQRSRRAR